MLRDNYESLRDAAVDATFGQMATLIETTEAGLQANIDTAHSTLVASTASNEATQSANLNSAIAVVDQNLSDVRSELAQHRRTRSRSWQRQPGRRRPGGEPAEPAEQS